VVSVLSDVTREPRPTSGTSSFFLSFSPLSPPRSLVSLCSADTDGRLGPRRGSCLVVESVSCLAQSRRINTADFEVAGRGGSEGRATATPGVRKAHSLPYAPCPETWLSDGRVPVRCPSDARAVDVKRQPWAVVLDLRARPAQVQHVPVGRRGLQGWPIKWRRCGAQIRHEPIHHCLVPLFFSVLGLWACSILLPSKGGSLALEFVELILAGFRLKTKTGEVCPKLLSP